MKYFGLPAQLSAYDETQLLNRYTEGLIKFIFTERLYEVAEEKLFKCVVGTVVSPNFQQCLKDEQVYLAPLSKLGKAKQDDDKRATCFTKVSGMLETFMLNNAAQPDKKLIRSCAEGFKMLALFYNEKDPKNRAIMLASNSRIGILCFTAKVLDVPKMCLEFDCRGKVSIVDNIATIDIGEIKTDIRNSGSKAKQQLEARLKTMEQALSVIAKDLSLEVTTINKVGRIFHATKEYPTTQTK